MNEFVFYFVVSTIEEFSARGPPLLGSTSEFARRLLSLHDLIAADKLPERTSVCEQTFSDIAMGSRVSEIHEN